MKKTEYVVYINGFEDKHYASKAEAENYINEHKSDADAWYEAEDVEMTPAEIKKEILANLPKGFKCTVSKSGLTIYLYKNLDDISFDEANSLVSKLCKKFKLDEVGSGKNLLTNVRDWELQDFDVEKQMIVDAKDALDHMKKFFKTYGNAYCASSKCYDIIEKMRALVATDEE